MHDHDDRLGDESLAASARRDAATAAYLAELEVLDRSSLAAADQIDFAIVRHPT